MRRCSDAGGGQGQTSCSRVTCPAAPPAPLPCCPQVGLPTVVNMDGTASANGHWQGAFERTSCMEFDRDRKMMSVTVAGEGKGFLFTKGAPESVLARCTQVGAVGGWGCACVWVCGCGLPSALCVYVLSELPYACVGSGCRRC
jgi:hypothetical protein